MCDNGLSGTQSWLQLPLPHWPISLKELDLEEFGVCPVSAQCDTEPLEPSSSDELAGRRRRRRGRRRPWAERGRERSGECDDPCSEQLDLSGEVGNVKAEIGRSHPES